MKWSYALMTVPQRRADLLPATLASLRGAGFDRPRLLVDGDNDLLSWQREFGLEVTCRFPRAGVAASWVWGLYEVYAREPNADRYAIFQDDFKTVRNLRAYLEGCELKPKTYWNLYSFPVNEALAPKGRTGWYESNQRGKGAVALVFDRPTVVTLLSSRHIAQRFQDPARGHKAIDGGIVEALGQQGYVELVHNPSLTQHAGRFSTMNKRAGSRRDEPAAAPKEWGAGTFATSFPGEDFDALDLLACTA